MKKEVSLEEKKDFIKWFLDQEQVRHRGAGWILNYLLNHEIVLNKVHFVEHAGYSPRGIVITAKSADAPDFTFYKDGKTFHNPERAFHDIRLNWHNNIYLELLFDGAWFTPEYLTVIEDNPFYTWNDNVPEETIELAHEGLDNLVYGATRDKILEGIDRALDQKDEKSFMQYSHLLDQLNQNSRE